MPDSKTYSQYFDRHNDGHGVVVFDNLGKDAKLVVPSPLVDGIDYSNLAAFFENAPEEQNHSLWKAVGITAKELVSEDPLWISIAGGGIAWLHVRLDIEPKYYRYNPYRIKPV